MTINGSLDAIFSDLRLLLENKSIKADEFKLFLKSVKSREVNNYLVGLSEGSKPEQILREVFFTHNAIFSRYLFKDIFPEVQLAYEGWEWSI